MKTQSIIVRSSNEQEMSVIKAFLKALKIKFEAATPCAPEFVNQIEKSRKQATEGKTLKI